MYKAITGYVGSIGSSRYLRATLKLACVLLLALLTPVVVEAYTIVLRSGRHVEIPAQFTVTSQTLTYEASPGINITLLMAAIDIPATERANKEGAGSLMKRVDKKAVEGPAVARLRLPRKQLTPADIEAARLAREKSERDYDRRRKELGLPSLEESRLRTLRETQRLVEDSRQARAEERQSEAYWRARANALRTEIVSIDRQIRYVHGRLSELPDYSGLEAYTIVTGAAPIYPLRHSVTTFPVVTGHPGFMRGTSDTRVLGPGFLAFSGNATHGRLHLAAAGARGGFARRIDRRGFLIPVTPAFGVAPFNHDYAYERANLINRLRELEAARAGLQARSRLLEEEARRSGAPPGWLRP